MRHEWISMDVDGFGDGETDFAALLAASPQSVRDDFDNKIMSTLVNGMTDGVVLVVTGHADRMDSGVDDHRARLLREGDVSTDRANSAVDTVLAMIGRDWLDPPPTSWEELPQIAGHLDGHGASWLINDGGDEAARRKNRRVSFSACRFFADE